MHSREIEPVRPVKTAAGWSIVRTITLALATAFLLASNADAQWRNPASAHYGGPQVNSLETFAPGSLIIPMDTDTTGNHATYNQNLGMWKAYGLLYELLSHGIPVNWAIQDGKAYNDIDFTAPHVKDLRTNTDLSSWSYRGGPFIIDAAYASAAMPIIQAWWATKSNQPNIHVVLDAPIQAEIDIVLKSPPRIAQEEIGSSVPITYYNAAGIPDANGNVWSSASPNVLTEEDIAGGALFQQGVCTSRQYDIYVTPHNTGFDYSLTDPTNLGTRTYAALDTFVHQGGGWTAMCHAVLSNENAIADLTLNGSAAVKAMFQTSLPGGQPGGFLTYTGMPDAPINSTGNGVWKVDNNAAGLPTAQIVPTTVAQALPGGAYQTWPSPIPTKINPAAPSYYPNTERVGFFDVADPALTDWDNIIAGTYHNGTGLGKLTYIGGHQFATTVPYSGNYEAPYLRAFYNSLFFNGSAVAKLDFIYSPTTFPQGGTEPLVVNVVNTGASVAENLHDVTVKLEPGFTYIAGSGSPAPIFNAGPPQTLTWTNLGDIPGGATAATFQLNVDSSISGSAGLKQFGTFHAVYGDIFGEGFTADVCRSVQVSPIPHLLISKTPTTQEAFAGAPVTWTVTYTNDGLAALNNPVLFDTLPPGFVYVSSSSSPALPTPVVTPGSPSTTIKWTFAAPLAAGASGTVTITALAASAQLLPYTNTVKLSGTDSNGKAYSATATANVTVLRPQLDLSIDKAVDKTFTELPPTPGVTALTYSSWPRAGTSLLENIRIIDPLPVGVDYVALSANSGGTYGAYVPIPKDDGLVDGPPTLNSTMSVSANYVQLGDAVPDTVTVTLNLKTTTTINTVSPGAIVIDGGTASCTGPVPASANVPSGATGVNFVWTCTVVSPGEYFFSAEAEDSAGTYAWARATSSSVMVAFGGPNVVAWNLGSNVAGVPGEVITAGTAAGIYAFRGANTKEFSKYAISTDSWAAKAQPTNGIEKGGSLTSDGVGTLYGLEGNSKIFYKYVTSTDTWTQLAQTSDNANEGGAVQYLKLGTTEYVFALLGGSNRFRRYDVATNTWTNMGNTPAAVKKGGALTTDGTYIYALQGDTKTGFWRCNATTTGTTGSCDTSWSTMASVPGGVGWGGSLVRVGGYIYALRGNGKPDFYRYDIAANTWTSMAKAPGNVADGGALTTDGTYIYAFQGKTKAFWRYDIASNTWLAKAPVNFLGNVGQGGALAYMPGVGYAGRTTSLSVSPTLVTEGDIVTVTMTLTSTTPVANVLPDTPTPTVTNGASCGSLSSWLLVSPDDDIAGPSDAVQYQWTCVADALTSAGTVKFSGGATGDGPTSFVSGTSNDVIVSPVLTFRAMPRSDAPTQIINTSFMGASNQFTASEPVVTLTGKPTLEITKSNEPPFATFLEPGGQVVYTMIVQNVGLGTASSIVVTDTVPTNTTYVSCDPALTCSQAGGVVTWTVASLAAGASTTVTMTIAAPYPTTLPISDTPVIIPNTASTYCAQKPTPVVSNEVKNQLQVKPTIDKYVDLTYVNEGATLTYTLKINNPGAPFTTDVTDPISYLATYVSGSCTTPTGTCSAGGSPVVVTWTGVYVPTGAESVTLTFQVTVNAGAHDAVDTVVNGAFLDPTSPNLAPIPSNEVETQVGDVPIAIDDRYSTTPDTPINSSVATNDLPSDDVPNNWTRLSDPVGVGDGLPHGTVTSFDPNTGAFTYVPDPNYWGGEVTFNYRICDASVPADCDDAVVTIYIYPPTVAKVREMDARQSGKHVLISWETEEETGNLGFNLWREEGGVRTKVNKSTIAGGGLMTKATHLKEHTYKFRDKLSSETASVLYWLEDIDVRGTTTMYGPVAPLPSPVELEETNVLLLEGIGTNAAVRETGLGVGVLRPATLPVPTAAQKKLQLELAAAKGLKIFVDSQGWYQVSRAQMVAAGFDPGNDPNAVALYSGGVEQSIIVNTGNDRKFDPNDTIEFYGYPLDTVYTGARTYWLRTKKGAARIQTVSAAGSPLNESVPFVYERSDRTVYSPDAPYEGETNNFFSLLVYEATDIQTLNVTNPDPAYPSVLRLFMQGFTAGDHRIRVELNNETLGEMIFTGTERVAAEFDVNAALINGANTLKLTAINPGDASLLASARLTYRHILRADGNLLEAEMPVGRRVTVGGFTSSSIRAFDVSDPAAPVSLPVSVAQSGPEWTAAFSVPGSTGSHAVIVFADDRVLTTTDLKANTTSNWSNSAEKTKSMMLIFTHGSLVTQAKVLETARDQQGIVTTTIDVEDVYDELNFGVRDPQAIRDFLQSTTSWRKPPLYAVLVGDASADPRNYLAVPGAADLVPTKFLYTAYMQASSDDWFTDFDGDAIADMAIGRLPVRNATEATTMINKIVSRGTPSGTWSSQALMIVDYNDTYPFNAVAADLATRIPSTITTSTLKFASTTTPRAAVVSALNSGQLLVDYIGHATLNTWRKATIFNSSDALGLTNGAQLPFLVALTCLNGRFEYPYVDVNSMAEAFMKAPNGGAVAVWASSTLTVPNEQHWMNQRLFDEMFGPVQPTIGEAVMRAKKATNDRDVRRSWNLFGDPSMKLR